MLTFSLHGLSPGHLVFSPDGSLLVLASYGGMQVYDVAAGRRLWGPVGGSMFYGDIWFTPDGRTLVAGDAGGFDARTGRPVDTPRPVPSGYARRVVLRSGCGRWVLTEYPLRLYDHQAGRSITLEQVSATLPRGRKPLFPVWGLTPLAFTADGELLAGRSMNKVVVLRTADMAAPAVADRPLVPPPPPPKPGFGTRVYRRLFGQPPELPPMPAAATVAAAAVLKIPRKMVQSAAFTPDGRALLAVSNEGLVRTWDTAGWAERTGYDFTIGPLKSVAVSPDGLLGAACGARRIVVWDLD